MANPSPGTDNPQRQKWTRVALGLLALTMATLLWADLTNGYVWVVLLIALGFGGIGLIDDYLKLTRRSSLPESASASSISEE